MKSGEGRVGPKLKLGPTELFSWRRSCLEPRKVPYNIPLQNMVNFDPQTSNINGTAVIRLQLPGAAMSGIIVLYLRP